MRILLFHNPKAGDREHRKKQLMAALAAFGHQPVYLSTKKRGWKKALDRSADVVVAAGGDDTERKVAWHLMDTGIPLAILPLGTANNLARSLGFTASADEIIAHLRRGKTRTLDVGIARGSSGKRFFLEGSGGGLFADYMRGADLKEDKDAPKKKRIEQHVSSLRKMSAHYPARSWKISVDGEDFSERYLLWEAMNIRSAGPALVLAPRAVSDDGRLDFVGVREHERDVFAKYLDARFGGTPTQFPFATCKFRELRIGRPGATMHFDGKFWPNKTDSANKRRSIEINVRPAALTIWEPAFSGR